MKRTLSLTCLLVASAAVCFGLAAAAQEPGQGDMSRQNFLQRGQLPAAASPDQLRITTQTSAEPFTPRDVQVGDPNANFWIVKITHDNRYLVWIDAKTDGSGDGVVWHCAIDPDTGNLDPPDCRGFRAFDSTVLNRANVGVDSRGVYYVGGDRDGRVVVVRPTGPRTGQVSVLPTPPDATRRGYYPSMIPTIDQDYIAWIKNENVAGGPGDGRNSWVELQYIDVAYPTQVRTIERQERPPIGFAPMDSEFFRWFDGKAAISFGSYAPDGRRELKEFDLSAGAPRLRFITNDGHRKADPYPWIFGNTEIITPGIDFQPVTYVYTHQAGSPDIFRPVESITVPSTTRLEKPMFSQSNKSIVWNGLGYTAYQITDLGAGGGLGGWFQLMSKPGEIWLSTVLQNPQRQWRISGPASMVRIEPKPCVGRSRVWVFYSETELGSDTLHATWHLRRADTPLMLE